MKATFRDLAINRKLQRLIPLLEEFLRPAVDMQLDTHLAAGAGTSRLGGAPDLPASFTWPENRGRKLDFIMQVSLPDVAVLDHESLLPPDGMLTFFYDLEAQPWGFDPKDATGHRVAYFPRNAKLDRRAPPNIDFRLKECALIFHEALTLPGFGSRDYGRLESAAKFSDNEAASYFELVADLQNQNRGKSETPRHHLLGHSENVQGDMQLEAQLVSHGLYCGDSSGYEDPRAREFAEGADDWTLLLQLDTDDRAQIMWGDCGMLYFWIPRQDMVDRHFKRVWAGLQCS